MSNSSLATEKYLAHKDNYTDGRSKKISEITIHHMAGVLSAKQCGAIFQKKGRNGSSNYGIGKQGEIALYVPEADTSWCNSNWESNCRAVTIEVSNSSRGGQWLVSDRVLESLILLVADIARRNNLGTLVKGKNVTWHSMYANTTCPGPYLLSKMDYIVKEANKINKKKATATTTPSVSSLKYSKNDKIILNGYLYSDSKGSRRGAKKTNYKGTITIVAKGASKPYHIDKIGWVAESSIKKQSSVSYYPKCSIKYVSIVSALNSIGVNSTFTYRKKIAQKNGYAGDKYKGTAIQNIALLTKLKAGKLIKI